MRRTSQGGSVFGFIVGGVLLTLLLVGGVYMIRQQTRTVQPAPITEEPTPSPEPEQPAAPSQEANPQSTPSQQTPTQLPSENVSTTPPTPREIPQTGPRETLIGAFAAALLVGTALAYTQSRRSVASL